MKDYEKALFMAMTAMYGMPLSKGRDIPQHSQQEHRKITCGMCKNFPQFGSTFCKLRKHAVNKSTPAGKCGFFKLKD